MADSENTPKPAPRPRRAGPRLWLMLAIAGLLAGVGMAVIMGLRFGPPFVMVGLGGMTLGLAALALWRVIDPLASPTPPRAEAPSAPARIRDVQREKIAVLKAIKEIELDFHMRKISEADYREMTHRYRVRAMRLIAELEAGDDYRALIEQELKHRVAVEKAAEAANRAPGAKPDAEAEA